VTAGCDEAGSGFGADGTDGIDGVAGSGAIAQPEGSLTASDAGSGGVSAAGSDVGGITGDEASSSTLAVAGSLVSVAVDNSLSLLFSRVTNAVTSPPVGTMATTDQPSAALAVSLVARAEGS
jgi:hypothetical protein